jgi:hypothetical protein
VAGEFEHRRAAARRQSSYRRRRRRGLIIVAVQGIFHAQDRAIDDFALKGKSRNGSI